ncbi:Phosphoglucosamine mutase [bioreactor metagenome]|uniref:Phosphoglucosamine mutase n=1 Tax=bioreactor metagenome TaxID=1076179 RepID=A0A644ZN87_9ZZZZ
MGRYFGTDGFRGKANETLTAEQAFKVGRYLGYYFSRQPAGRIIVGRDTRLSGSMLESAIAAGITPGGCHVDLLGVCPTPAIAYLVSHNDYSCGVMISASHNPYYDNGIKVFNARGMKLEAAIEQLIEDYLDGRETIPYALSDHIQTVTYHPEYLDQYLDFIRSLFDFDLAEYKIVCDLANGSATATAVRLLSKFRAQLTVINDRPDGLNINTQCGSTHPEGLVQLMKTGRYDLGLAFDGDADRLIAVDETGGLIDGDKALYVLGKQMIAHHQLKDQTIVTTVMANFGLYKCLEHEQIKYEKTAVGDKYVYDCMLKNDYKLGGEQSGHIIFKDLMTTGDGLLTAMKLLEVLHETKRKMSELAKPLFIYPQLLVNLKVKDKKTVLDDQEIQELIDQIQDELGQDGRILVRPSGTEPLIRIMVEAKRDEICHHHVYRVVDLIEQKGL